MSFCADCVRGVTHEGTPQGKIEAINDVECYIATPEGEYAKDVVLLFLTDVFGIPLNNNKLLADDFARNGIKTIIPDYLNGDPVPADAMSPGSTFSLDPWKAIHTPVATRPLLDRVVQGLRDQGVTKFAATGYCFGGRYTFDLAFDGVIKVAVVAHPSLLQVPSDLEKYRDTAKAPLLINSCENDGAFPKEAQAKADEILGNGKFAPGYKREYFAGCTHGFAVRGDLSNPLVKAGKEKAFKSTVEWLKNHL
ncbi:alpha/beta-hydrolase [Fistulina hepatica ATCC 64428]|uniref:Alpha/beta-hydrolase n=1 Tax=Fistulina hepatica ATCC 64428 TaxID=1128425 RepID=A0A0D7AEU9_9AGAR|nr:alpha/beta-hydrolase [Fistulina hepatica ATCC 64428]